LEHLHELGKINKHGKWIPHQLSQENLNQRLTICSSLLSRAKRLSFFERIVTGDEKWILYDNNQRKNQWLDRGQASEPTPKPGIFTKKVMLCVWWNFSGVIHFELMKPGQTITAEVYSSQLDRVQHALLQIGIDTSRTLLLHDNAKPHTAKKTLEKIEELGWEVLPHAPYSPDLAPSDYYLFRSMQHELAENHFKKEDDVKIFVQRYFDSKPPEFYKAGIEKLRGRWREVIVNNGTYIAD
jgi:histone-lysine N-methyltransferase SETMAR